jgi:hypothetical protein
MLHKFPDQVSRLFKTCTVFLFFLAQAVRMVFVTLYLPSGQISERYYPAMISYPALVVVLV